MLEFRKIYIFLINSFFLYIPHTVVLKWDALIFFKLLLFNNKVKYFKKFKKWYKRTYWKKQADSHTENTFMLNKGNSRGRGGEIN